MNADQSTGLPHTSLDYSSHPSRPQQQQAKPLGIRGSFPTKWPAGWVSSRACLPPSRAYFQRTHLLVQPHGHIRSGRHGPPDGRHVRRVVELALGGVPDVVVGGCWERSVVSTRGVPNGPSLGPRPHRFASPRRGNCGGDTAAQAAPGARHPVLKAFRMPGPHFVGNQAARGRRFFAQAPRSGGGEHLRRGVRSPACCLPLVLTCRCPSSCSTGTLSPLAAPGKPPRPCPPRPLWVWGSPSA